MRGGAPLVKQFADKQSLGVKSLGKLLISTVSDPSDPVLGYSEAKARPVSRFGLGLKVGGSHNPHLGLWS